MDKDAFQNYDIDKNLVENEKDNNLRRSLSLNLQSKDDYHTVYLKKLEEIIDAL